MTWKTKAYTEAEAIVQRFVEHFGAINIPPDLMSFAASRLDAIANLHHKPSAGQEDVQPARAKCPHCDASPISYAFIPGQSPGGEYFIIELFCSACHSLLPGTLMRPVPPRVQSPNDESRPRIIPPA